MGYTLKMRIWRGDQSGGDLGDYDVEVSEGEVGPRPAPRAARPA